jgi:hypothetical protein
MIKLIDLLKEDNPFVPRGGNERMENFYKNKIQQYVKDGMKGDLNLSNTPITSLPDNLTTVGGDLFLEYSKITKLPDNLTVIGKLDLSNTPITTLPDNLTVGAWLKLEGAKKIKSLPSSLRVKTWISIQNTPLSKKYSKDEIRAMIPNVEGNIRM